MGKAHQGRKQFVPHVNRFRVTYGVCVLFLFFDWDDTLFPCSFLTDHGYIVDFEWKRPRPDNVNEDLKQLSASVAQLLQKACDCGEVAIITNSGDDWVLPTAREFLPDAVPLLKQHIKIQSAKAKYRSMFPISPQAPQKWKFCSFHEFVWTTTHSDSMKNKNTNNKTTIVSFGDSELERTAVQLVARGMGNTRYTSLKFVSKPTIAQLQHQIELITKTFDFLVTSDKDIDIELNVS